ncbi:MAG: sigma-70 family RNA polymerase sigma factor [Phycisphaeraceae bacterium]|nr:sigma-70 family RNA polymerase sigma factor [Phycisphaeraceae bacterium]
MQDPMTATSVTMLLQQAGSGGDREAGERLAPLVLAELRKIAERAMARERKDHTLQPTLLADEAFMKLVGQDNIDWQSRTQFYAYAAIAIRRILVDHARAHGAGKRGGGHDRIAMESMDQLGDTDGPRPIDVLDLDEALESLATLDQRQARIVELKFFGGMSIEQIAHVMGVSPRTVNGDWAMARAWLKARLTPRME